MSYDSKCYWLAQKFLEEETDIDTKDATSRLAQRIQDTIEEFIEEEEKG